jgi:L-lysine exporter family protein LysE/ArgO
VLNAALTGFATGLSLILVIGAQNAYVLRRGLAGTYVLPVVLFCAISDTLLICAGVASFGGLAVAAPWVVPVLTLSGVTFLVIYGAISMWRALDPGSLRASEGNNGSLRTALATCFALTWLNPHVYLDTVGLIGAVSSHYNMVQPKAAIALGAALASFVFFYTLGYGARFLAPMFARPGAWAVLDAVIAVVMWTIAYTLMSEFLIG